LTPCGTISGRGGGNKFDTFKLTPVPAYEVVPPLIDEFPVNVECRVIDINTVGDHDLFFGEATAIHVDEDRLQQVWTDVLTAAHRSAEPSHLHCRLCTGAPERGSVLMDLPLPAGNTGEFYHSYYPLSGG
jgi:flavin reductase (DIM6/NTAB) family NADH-FMN oxidoreductase RutF